MCPIEPANSIRNNEFECVECAKRLVYFQLNGNYLNSILTDYQTFNCLNTDDEKFFFEENKTLFVNNSVKLANYSIIQYTTTLSNSFEIKTIKFPHHFLTCSPISIYFFVSIFLFINLILLILVIIFLFKFWMLYSHTCK